jgi:hypothetical protein
VNKSGLTIPIFPEPAGAAAGVWATTEAVKINAKISAKSAFIMKNV